MIIMNEILCVTNLSKSYKGEKVVDEISFEVKKGEIIGFLGPNGAGKSTTINMISTITDKDSGNIAYNGINVDKNINTFKKALGVVPQELAFFNDMTAYDNVKFFASLYGLKGTNLLTAVEDALISVGLWDRRKKYPKTFSGGMKRRLNIACSIVYKPEILIMDEPTVGIDPQSRNLIMETIDSLNAQGTTVIYVSHYMEEVQRLCKRVLIMDKGRILDAGENEALLKKYDCDTLEEMFLKITGKSMRDN